MSSPDGNDGSHPRPKYRPARVPSEWCVCGHLREDHDRLCVVIEYNVRCQCRGFVPVDYYDDDVGNSDEGGSGAT